MGSRLQTKHVGLRHLVRKGGLGQWCRWPRSVRRCGWLHVGPGAMVGAGWDPQTGNSDRPEGSRDKRELGQRLSR